MSDRGMKKWVAYRALVEQATALSKTHLEKRKIEKPLISNDRAEEINEILVNYNNEELLITYYEEGFIKETITRIESINIYNKTLLLQNKKTLLLSNLLNLEIIN